MSEATLNSGDYALPSEGLTEPDRKKRLDEFYRYIKTQESHFIGYQADQKLDYAEDLSRFLNVHVNNIGDPFVSGGFTVNSKEMEVAVLDYYAELWHANLPHDPRDPESYWGYVLTMGSSEGNIYGLWNARDYLAGRKLIVDEEAQAQAKTAAGPTPFVERYLQARCPDQQPNAYTPVAFFSEDTHYSIIKYMRVLQIDTYDVIGKKLGLKNPLTHSGEWDSPLVPSECGKEGPGSIDVEKLATLVDLFAGEGFPILINCNYGSTFKGAYDDVDRIGQTLMPLFEKYGLVDRQVEYDDNSYDIRNGYWIHVDGALGSSYMPFLQMAHKKYPEVVRESGPAFDFALPWVNSIVMSGHKWPGAPWPCGVFMTKVKYQLFPPDNPEYIGSPDTTFAGSRNGFSPVVLWDYLARHSYKVQTERAFQCEKIVQYAVQELKKLEQKTGMDLWVARTPLSLTTRFRKPNDALVFKYSLSCETLALDDGEVRPYAHLFAMDAVSEAMIDQFVDDLGQPGAFDEEVEKKLLRAAAPARPRVGRGAGWR